MHLGYRPVAVVRSAGFLTIFRQRRISPWRLAATRSKQLGQFRRDRDRRRAGKKERREEVLLQVCRANWALTASRKSGRIWSNACSRASGENELGGAIEIAYDRSRKHAPWPRPRSTAHDRPGADDGGAARRPCQPDPEARGRPALSSCRSSSIRRQFGPNEDLVALSSAFRDRCQACDREGVDLIFHPSRQSMYPPGFSTYVEVHGCRTCCAGRRGPAIFAASPRSC